MKALRAELCLFVVFFRHSAPSTASTVDILIGTRMMRGMAQKTVVSFIDDLDGESEAEGTVTFGLDGVEYEIDLTTENAEDLRDIFAPYIAAARRTGGRRSTGGDPEPIELVGLRPWRILNRQPKQGSTEGDQRLGQDRGLGCQ